MNYVLVSAEWLLFLVDAVDDLAEAVDSNDDEVKLAALRQVDRGVAGWPQAVAA